MQKTLYVKNYKEFETYEKIYHAILDEALAGSEDNGRIDNNCFKSLISVLDDEEIEELNALKEFKASDIAFVVYNIDNDVEIVYDDGNLGVNK